MFHIKAIEIIARSLRDAVKTAKEGREGMALGQYVARYGLFKRGARRRPFYGSYSFGLLRYSARQGVRNTFAGGYGL